MTAVILLAAMCGIMTCVGQSRLHAQDAAEFRVYRLSQDSPLEVRRILTELLGGEAGNIKIVADEERSELLVSESADEQQLTEQLVQQLNASASEAPVEKTPIVVKSYSVIRQDLNSG